MPAPATEVRIVVTVELRLRHEDLARSLIFHFRFLERARIILLRPAGCTTVRWLAASAARDAWWSRGAAASPNWGCLAWWIGRGRDDLRGSAPLDRHEIIAMACQPLQDYVLQRSRWTIATLREAALAAKRVGPTSETSVWKIPYEVDLKPHKYRMWLYRKEPQFEEKMHDLVRLYQEGRRRAVSPRQAACSLAGRRGLAAATPRHLERPPADIVARRGWSWCGRSSGARLDAATLRRPSGPAGRPGRT